MTQPFEDIRVHHADVAHFVEWKKQVKADVYLTEIGYLLSAVDALMGVARAVVKLNHGDTEVTYKRLNYAIGALPPELKEALK